MSDAMQHLHVYIVTQLLSWDNIMRNHWMILFRCIGCPICTWYSI